MIFKKFLLIFVVFVLFICASNYTKGFCENPKVVIGFDANYPPIGFLDENGIEAGFDIEIAKTVFEFLGIETIFQPINWDAKEMELNTGKIDVIWNGLSKTKEREEKMLLTKPYMKNRQIVIVKSNSKIDSLDDLSGKTICVQSGSSAKDSIESSALYPKIKEIIEVESMINCLNEVESDRSDSAVFDEFLLKNYLKNNLYNFKVLEEELATDYFVVAVKKGREDLKEKIETGLDAIYSNNKASQISKKWFNENLFFWEKIEISETQNVENKKIYLKLLKGLITTLNLFFVIIFFSVPFGFLVCALLNSTKSKILKFLIIFYINIMRGTPLLLQLFFIFYGVSYIPLIGNHLVINDRFLASITAFIFNYSAYFAEIFRGGFLSINQGQIDAAKSLSLQNSKIILKIILPQILLTTLPSICNETVSLVKDTSLVFSVGIQELLSSTKSIVNTTSNTSAYLYSALIYFSVSSIIIKIFKNIEKQMSKLKH